MFFRGQKEIQFCQVFTEEGQRDALQAMMSKVLSEVDMQQAFQTSFQALGGMMTKLCSKTLGNTQPAVNRTGRFIWWCRIPKSNRIQDEIWLDSVNLEWESNALMSSQQKQREQSSVKE